MSAYHPVTHVRPRMGTFLAVTVLTRRRDVQVRYVRTAFDLVAALERVMSRHDPTSELSRLNRTAGCPGVRSPNLAPILRLARALVKRTGGALDPTVGPLLDLWRRASRRGQPPSRRLLQKTRTCVGWRGIQVKDARVSLACPGMAVDLGGLGKGLTLDRIASALKRYRSVSALLNFGESSLLPVGALFKAGWPVLLRHPLGGFAGEFKLWNRACSTSRTYGQTATVGGRIIGHIVDPRSGRPVRALAQVTVLARSAAVAEAASTALLVLGRSAMARLAERLKVDVCWIDRSGIHTTRGFPLRRPA